MSEKSASGETGGPPSPSLPFSRSRTVPKIGEILVHRGYTTGYDVQGALEEQTRTKRPLGEILVARGNITPEQLSEALHAQLRLQITAGVLAVAIAFGAPFQSLAGQTGTIGLRGYVPTAISLQLPKTDAFLKGDLQAGHTGPITTIIEHTNAPTGYVVTVESQNAAVHGKPVLIHAEGKQGAVEYSLKYNGSDIQFKNGSAVLTSSGSPTRASVEKELSITTHAAERLSPGPYRDVLRFTITHNR